MLTLILLVGMSMASLDLRKQANTEAKARKLYMPASSPLSMYGDSLYSNAQTGRSLYGQPTRMVTSRRYARNGLNAGGANDEFQNLVTASLRETEQALERKLDGEACTVTEDINQEYKEEDPDTVTSLIMFESDVFIDVIVLYKLDGKLHRCPAQIAGGKITTHLEGLHKTGSAVEVIVQVTKDDNIYKKKYMVENGELKELSAADSETVVGQTTEVEGSVTTGGSDDISGNVLKKGKHKVTLIHRARSLLVADEVEITDGHLTAEPAGEHLETQIIVADAIIHEQDGDTIEEVILDHGEVKEPTENSHTDQVSVPDLTASGDTHVTIVETTDTQEKVFEADIHDGTIVSDETVPSEVLEGEHDIQVITHEEGVPVLQTVHEVDGVLVGENSEEINVVNAEPVAEILSTGIVSADAIVETEEGPTVEPVVFNNGELVQEPVDVSLHEGTQQIDVIMHDAQGPHMEHVQLVDGHVTEAIADEISESGIAQEGEQHVDVLIHDQDGYHVEDILVKDDQVVEEPSNMDLEHGQHLIDTVVHDNSGPHIEHWKIEEGTVITHHAETYIESHGHTQTAIITGSHTSHTTTHVESGTVHVEMLLNYGKEASLEDVLLHDGMIVQESPGIDLQHGVHVAEAITKDILGPSIQPVVIHDGIVEATAPAPVEEAHVNITHGDVHAEMIEGEGPNAKVENVTIHDGKIVDESGNMNLAHGTHEVETVILDTAQPQIEEDVIVDGEVRPVSTEDETQHALIVLREGDNTGVSEVEIHDHMIVEQSEGTDLTTGAFVGTEIDINAHGGVESVEEIVGNEGVISPITHHIEGSTESESHTSGEALIVVESPTGTAVDQITYDGAHITSETGPIDLSQPTSGVEVVLDPETHNVEAAHQVEIVDHTFTVIDQQPVVAEELTATHTDDSAPLITDEAHHTSEESHVVESIHQPSEEVAVTSTETQFENTTHVPLVENANTSTETQYENTTTVPSEVDANTSTETQFENTTTLPSEVDANTYTEPVSRRAYIRPNYTLHSNNNKLYSAPYNPIKNRGLNNNRFTPNIRRQPVVNRIAVSHPPLRRYATNIRYQPVPLRPVQVQPRSQQTVYHNIPAYHPVSSQMFSNIRTTRGRGNSMHMIKQPMIPFNANRYNRVAQDQTIAHEETAATPVHSEVVAEQQLTFDDIPLMIDSIDKVEKKYTSYYSTFPYSETDKKLLVSSHEDVMNYYERMRRFVRVVIEDRNHLLAEFDIILKKSNLLTAGEKEMISFYGYHNTYENINDQLKGYKVDSKVTEYQKTIDVTAEKFAVEVKAAHTASANLVKLEEYFSTEISQINQIAAESETLRSLEKYDRMLALGMKLIELRTELETNISDLKSSLMKINHYKSELDTSISGLKFMLDEGRLVKIGAVDSKSSVTKMIVTLGVLFLLL